MAFLVFGVRKMEMRIFYSMYRSVPLVGEDFLVVVIDFIEQCIAITSGFNLEWTSIGVLSKLNKLETYTNL